MEIQKLVKKILKQRYQILQFAYLNNVEILRIGFNNIEIRNKRNMRHGYYRSVEYISGFGHEYGYTFLNLRYRSAHPERFIQWTKKFLRKS